MRILILTCEYVKKSTLRFGPRSGGAEPAVARRRHIERHIGRSQGLEAAPQPFKLVRIRGQFGPCIVINPVLAPEPSLLSQNNC